MNYETWRDEYTGFNWLEYNKWRAMIYAHEWTRAAEYLKGHNLDFVNASKAILWHINMGVSYFALHAVEKLYGKKI
jgi:hypothetical protein